MNDYYDSMPDSGVNRDSIKCKLRGHYSFWSNAVQQLCHTVVPYNAVLVGRPLNFVSGVNGPITHQKATKMEQNVCCMLQSHQKTHNKEDLVSTCRVHLMRLDAFQCELCEAVYAEKQRLLQHLESVHRSRPQNSSFVKFRKINRLKHAADNDTIPPLTTSRKYHGKKRTEKDKTMPMKSYQGQQQQHLVCRPWAMSSNSFKCDVCGRAFLMQHLLRAHMKLHQEKSSKTSVVTSGLVAGPSNQSRNATAKMGPYRRKSLHPDIGLLVGNVCDAKFSTKRVLKNNFGTHTGHKPYKCSECDAKFASMGSLTLHMRVHTGEKPYQCGTCGARFTQCGALTMHVRFHTGERPYQCDACDAKFVQKCDLIQHRRVHTGEKPYRCDTCNARFARSNHLNLHMRIHTGEKPYNCNMCDERFSSSIKVTAHMRIHLGKTGKRAYTGKKPYQCDTCEAQFARRNNLTVHKKIHTR